MYTKKTICQLRHKDRTGIIKDKNIFYFWRSDNGTAVLQQGGWSISQLAVYLFHQKAGIF
jgi:hypothetical protein